MVLCPPSLLKEECWLTQKPWLAFPPLVTLARQLEVLIASVSCPTVPSPPLTTGIAQSLMPSPAAVAKSFSDLVHLTHPANMWCRVWIGTPHCLFWCALPVLVIIWTTPSYAVESQLLRCILIIYEGVAQIPPPHGCVRRGSAKCLFPVSYIGGAVQTSIGQTSPLGL